MRVDLSKFSVAAFDRGASRFKEAVWVVVRCMFFTTIWPWPSRLRVALLRKFGAQVGQGVIVRSRVNIWFPWRLTLGNHVWLGEEVFILNFAQVSVAAHVCISQRAFICTGSHNYKSTSFDLIVKPITVEDGAWLGAGSWVGPGVRVGNHAVLTAGSVASEDLEPFGIYRGNPAVFVRSRVISSSVSSAP